MPDIREWSTTPADNATAGSINWAEGQPPSTVNDSARQMMADERGQWNDGGWFVWGDTHTYASATATTTSGDQRSTYLVGRRARASGATTGTIYGAISAVTFSSNTAITYVWDSGSLTNETLTLAVSYIAPTGNPVPAIGVVSGGTGRDSLTANNVILGNGTSAVQFVAPGTSGNVLTSNGTTWASASAPSTANFVINGNFSVNQRAPATNADDTYAHDRWYVLTQTNTIAVSTVSNAEDGTPYMARLTQSQASAQRMGYAQILESAEAVALRGKTVTFRFGRIRCSSSQAIRYAVLEWTGTADSVTSDVVNDWTSGTYTAGNFFLASNLTVSGVTSQTPSAATLTDGTSLTVTLGSSLNNIIVFAWTEGTAAQNVTLDLAKAQLEVGSSATDFKLQPYSQIISQCQRFYWRSNYGAGTAGYPGFAGYNAGGAGCYWPVAFPTTMRISPTTVNTNGTWATSNCGGPSIAGQSQDGLTILVTASGTGAFFTIPNSTDDYIFADAEL